MAMSKGPGKSMKEGVHAPKPTVTKGKIKKTDSTTKIPGKKNRKTS